MIECQRCGDTEDVQSYEATDGDQQAELCEPCHDAVVGGLEPGGGGR